MPRPVGSTSPTSNLDVDALIREYNAGASLRELGERYYVSQTTVRRRLIAAHVRLRSSAAGIRVHFRGLPTAGS